MVTMKSFLERNQKQLQVFLPVDWDTNLEITEPLQGQHHPSFTVCIQGPTQITK